MHRKEWTCECVILVELYIIEFVCATLGTHSIRIEQKRNIQYCIQNRTKKKTQRIHYKIVSADRDKANKKQNTIG